MRRLAPVLALALVPLGCSTTRELVAADGSHRLLAGDPASGVTMILTTEVWSGDAIYGEDLTIVHVLVANMGSEPILLAPGDFELSDRQGFDYVLYDSGANFSVVPEGIDPDTYDATREPFAYDPGRSTAFDDIETFDGELARTALPWGVLLPGTQMRGFLYFADVRDRANHATLVWHVQTPEHRPVVDLGFELHVAVLDRDRT